MSNFHVLLVVVVVCTLVLSSCNANSVSGIPVAFYSDGNSPVYANELFENETLNDISIQIAAGENIEIDKCPICIHAKGVNGVSLLWVAVRFENAGAAEELLEAGAAVTNDVRYAEGIMAHAARGPVRILELLLDYGANPDAVSLDPYGQPAIHYAASFSSFDSVKILLEAGANIDACDSQGNTALFAAGVVGDLDMVFFLLNKGADPRIRNKSGNTFLQRILSRSWNEESAIKIKKISDWLEGNGFRVDELLEETR